MYEYIKRKRRRKRKRKKEINPLQRGQTEGHRFPLEIYSPIKVGVGAV
jgi:hypothetical protein